MTDIERVARAIHARGLSLDPATDEANKWWRKSGKDVQAMYCRYAQAAYDEIAAQIGFKP